MSDIDEVKAIERLRAKYRKDLEGNPTFLAYEELGKALDQMKRRLGGKDFTETPSRRRQVRRARLKRSGAKETQPDLVAKFLEGAAKPLSAAKLVEKLEAMGRPVGGDKKTINLSSVLSKDGRFQSHQWPFKGVYVWWFKDRPLPESDLDDEVDALLAPGVLNESKEASE